MEDKAPSRKRKRGRKRDQSAKQNASHLEVTPRKVEFQEKYEEKVAVSTSKRKLGLSNSSNFLEKGVPVLEEVPDIVQEVVAIDKVAILMKARLSGGHFRMINEKLYTCTGKEALEYFMDDPTLFDMYHAGYQEQMSHWPEQPVNIIIKWLRDRSPSLVVADFGCGDARLAKNVKNKVFSFDLVSRDASIIACDMSNTPLDTSSVDVAVFCLSLMGTTFSSYVEEAHRVLKPCGWLLIAEVKSRFDPNTGGADPKKFIKAVSELGFSLEIKDFSNKMFVLLYFKKKVQNTKRKGEIEWPELKPCLYKRR